MLDKLKETPLFFNSPAYEHYSHIQSPWHKKEVSIRFMQDKMGRMPQSWSALLSSIHIYC